MSDLQAVTVPKELYYHETAYVRGLEDAARAMLAALIRVQQECVMYETITPKTDVNVRAAIAQAVAAGIKAQP